MKNTKGTQRKGKQDGGRGQSPQSNARRWKMCMIRSQTRRHPCFFSYLPSEVVMANACTSGRSWDVANPKATIQLKIVEALQLLESNWNPLSNKSGNHGNVDLLSLSFCTHCWHKLVEKPSTCLCKQLKASIVKGKNWSLKWWSWWFHLFDWIAFDVAKLHVLDACDGRSTWVRSTMMMFVRV
jgi:hypothetical protein